MSTDWNVHCRTCSSTTYFNDANHAEDVMAALCKHASEIGALADLVKSQGCVRLETMWGVIDAPWFREHAGHDLIPISEYGDFLDQCTEYVDCTCGSRRRCTKRYGHDREHIVEARKR